MALKPATARARGGAGARRSSRRDGGAMRWRHDRVAARWWSATPAMDREDGSMEGGSTTVMGGGHGRLGLEKRHEREKKKKKRVHDLKA